MLNLYSYLHVILLIAARLSFNLSFILSMLLTLFNDDKTHNFNMIKVFSAMCNLLILFTSSCNQILINDL